jgi:hypothetical protein
VSSIGNSQLKWEKTTGFNYGTDFVIFNGRLSGNFEFYNTTTNDLLFNVRIPTMTGFSEITTNIGEIQNRGFEFTLNPVFVKTKDVKWDMAINFSRNVNEIVKLIGLDADGDGNEDDLIASNLFIGESIGTVYGYKTDGMHQIGEEPIEGYPTGSMKIVDTSNDGNITPDDRVILGRQEPAYRFSVFNSVGYKKFVLRVLINSVQGGKDGFLGENMPPSSLLANNEDNPKRYNFVKEFDFWTPANPDAKYRHPARPGAIDPKLYFDRSFIRLQDVSLTYRFGRNFLENVNIADLSIFVSGKNLATWTKWVGWDPETGQGIDPTDAMPVLKSYSLGLNITF